MQKYKKIFGAGIVFICWTILLFKINVITNKVDEINDPGEIRYEVSRYSDWLRKELREVKNNQNLLNKKVEKMKIECNRDIELINFKLDFLQNL